MRILLWKPTERCREGEDAGGRLRMEEWMGRGRGAGCRGGRQRTTSQALPAPFSSYETGLPRFGFWLKGRAGAALKGQVSGTLVIWCPPPHTAHVSWICVCDQCRLDLGNKPSVQKKEHRTWSQEPGSSPGEVPSVSGPQFLHLKMEALVGLP